MTKLKNEYTHNIIHRLAKHQSIKVGVLVYVKEDLVEIKNT